MKHFIVNHKLQIISFLIVIGLAALPSLYFYNQYQIAQKRLSNPERTVKEEVARIISQVSKLIDVPSDEEPTVATIADRDKLKDQPFFAKAKNGDKVLIYTKAKKAILFDPITNKILEVAPVSIGPTAQTATAGATKSSNLRFSLRNGTTVVGLTKNYETQLTKVLPDAQVVEKTNAQKQDYTKSLLVDVNGTKSSEIIPIAQALGLTVGGLPKDEPKPESDYLIILGLDQK